MSPDSGWTMQASDGHLVEAEGTVLSSAGSRLMRCLLGGRFGGSSADSDQLGF
jgi:hypothetical protein